MSSSASHHRVRPLPASVPRVLRADDAVHLRHADTVVSQSEALLRVVAPEPEASVAETIERERAEAYAEGVAAGRAEALAEADLRRAEALADAVRVLREAAAAARRVRQALAREVTEDALELTYELARTLLDDEVVRSALPPQLAVARAIELAPEGEDLVVRLPPGSPLDLEALAPFCDPARISLREDAAVEVGGCIVEVGACRIDGQISTALERVRKVLDEARRQPSEVVA